MKTENLKCTRCFNDLIVEEVVDDVNLTELICPNCGARYTCYEPEESERMEYDFYKNGEDISGRITEPDIYNSHCTNCGHHVYVVNNFMLSDYDDTITDDDDDCMNYIICECPNCGMNEERWDTPENQKKHFPYWKEDLEENQKNR